MAQAPVVDSAFDVAFWFLDRALNDNEYLQPQKLHRLLYLAQGYYGALTRGRKLMPAVFVIDTAGPVEPTLYRAFETGRPMVQTQSIPEDAEHFLDSVWRRFGPYSTDHLSRLVRGHAPVREAAAHGRRTEIDFAAMTAFYGTKGRRRSPREAPAAREILRLRIMRSQHGRPVNVHRWTPRSLKDGDAG